MITSQKSKPSHNFKQYHRSTNHPNPPSTQHSQNGSFIKNPDKNIIPNKNNKISLKTHIEQQNIAIDKLMENLYLSICSNAQNVVTQTIDKLKIENKNLLECLKEVEKQDTERNNNQQVSKNSLQKVGDPLPTSESKPTLDQIENPQNQPKPPIPQLKPPTTQPQQPPIPQSPPQPSIKHSPQQYQITLQPTLPLPPQQKKQQPQQLLQLIPKLEQAIYYLKKQLNEKQQLCNKKIGQLTNTHQLQMKNIQQEFEEKIVNLEQLLTQKNQQIIQIEKTNSNHLKQLSQSATNMNTQFRSIIADKQLQLTKKYQQLKSTKQIIRLRQLRNAQLNQIIKMLQIKLQEKSEQLILNEQKQNKFLFLHTDFKNINKDKDINNSKDNDKKQCVEQEQMINKQITNDDYQENQKQQAELTSQINQIHSQLSIPQQDNKQSNNNNIQQEIEKDYKSEQLSIQQIKSTQQVQQNQTKPQQPNKKPPKPTKYPPNHKISPKQRKTTQIHLPKKSTPIKNIQKKQELFNEPITQLNKQHA